MFNIHPCYFACAVVPAVVVEPPLDEVVLLEQDAVFECRGDSDPVHSTVWIYNMSELVNGTKYMISGETHTKLVVKNVSLTDSGLYSCVIKNEYRMDSATARLQVQGTSIDYSTMFYLLYPLYT